MIMILLLYYLLRMSDMINIRFLYDDVQTRKKERNTHVSVRFVDESIYTRV